MDAQTVAASSPAEAVDVFNGETPTLSEYNQYRQSGEVPERFKPAEKAEPAPAQVQAEGETPESDPESATEPDSQEKPQPVKKGKTASERVAQLKATIEQLWEQEEPDTVRIVQLETTIDKIEQRSGQKRKTEPAPVSQQTQAQEQPRQPQTYTEWEQAFNPEKWVEEYAKANPNASYERANAAMFSHMLNVREQFKAHEQANAAQRQAVEKAAQEAVERYGNGFYAVKDSFIQATVGPNGPLIPAEVLSMVADSDVMADLVYVIAEDPDSLSRFVHDAKTNRNAAIRYIASIESEIKAEFAKGDTSTERNEKGQFKKAAPPAKQQTQAPKPPSPVGGTSSGRFDVSDESLSADEWFRQRNAQLSKR